ncbi:MAG: hypothetical protein KAH32_03400 [Chlamydiia bacterium]|nr:hypothetical protein [Chlamydiia bacterium]
MKITSLINNRHVGLRNHIDFLKKMSAQTQTSSCMEVRKLQSSIDAIKKIVASTSRLIGDSDQDVARRNVYTNIENLEDLQRVGQLGKILKETLNADKYEEIKNVRIISKIEEFLSGKTEKVSIDVCKIHKIKQTNESVIEILSELQILNARMALEKVIKIQRDIIIHRQSLNECIKHGQ